MKPEPTVEVPAGPVVQVVPDPIHAPPATATAAFDPFAVENLRVDQNVLKATGRKIILVLPTRKPGNQEFFQVHPDPAYRDAALIFDHEKEGIDKEQYLISAPSKEDRNEIVAALGVGVKLKLVYTCVTTQSTPFLWPVPLPGADGKTWPSHTSAHEVATDYATKGWVKLTYNKTSKGYDVTPGTAIVNAPVWPELTFNELLRKAFKDRIITSLEHPVVREILYGAS